MMSDSNALNKAIDIDGALTKIFNKDSPKWKAMKKIRKCGQISILSSFGQSLWDTIKELKAFISMDHLIRYNTLSFLNDTKALPETNKAIHKSSTAESAVPIVTKMASSKVRDNFVAVLRQKCIEYKMTLPIIVYGRLFDEQRFQYVSFVFEKRAFVIELANSDINDVHQRASETMCSLIREFGGVPKVSLFVKVSRKVAHVVAEIDLQNKTLAPCESAPGDLKILDLNEILNLIIASHFVSNEKCSRIQDLCAKVDKAKKPFLEGFYVKNVFRKAGVFGYVDPSELGKGQRPHPTTLVFCDAYTQSNFLWNERPQTVNVNRITPNFIAMTPSKVPYQQIELLPFNVPGVPNDIGIIGGVIYGDYIPYTEPFVVKFD